MQALVQGNPTGGGAGNYSTCSCTNVDREQAAVLGPYKRAWATTRATITPQAGIRLMEPMSRNRTLCSSLLRQCPESWLGHLGEGDESVS